MSHEPILCGRCYQELDSEEELYDSNCNEKPEKRLGHPIGQYHCLIVVPWW